jgi:hypothetical protein
LERDALTHKRCPRCEQHKPTTEYYKCRKAYDGLQSLCKSCDDARNRIKFAENPFKKLYWSKKAHAKKIGAEFTITFEEIVWPDYCPVLGTKLRYERYTGRGSGGKYDSPSFDRIDPNRGYVPGNVLIVSHKANTIKSNATVEQLEKVASFYRQLVPQVGVPNAANDNQLVHATVA